MKVFDWYWKDGFIFGKDIDGNQVITDTIIYTYDDVATDVEGKKYILYNKRMDVSSELNELILKVEDWAEKRGIFEHSTAKDQALKTVAEVGEFADNVLKGRDCRDDIGDIIVTLILQCILQGTTLTECLSLAYEEIAARKGKMINGTFVKEEDNHE